MNFNNASFEASFGVSSQLKKSTVPEIVFSGRSNVGKSSLINKITNRKALARTSSRPGKTGTINFYDLKEFKLVDLPGYGYARVSDSEKKRWAELVEGYFNSNRNISLVIQIIDMRHPPTKDDIRMINYLKSMNFKFIIILTKSDKLNKTEKSQRLFEFENSEITQGLDYIVFSALKGEGTKEIQEFIKNSILL